jgi:hypothetical protein
MFAICVFIFKEAYREVVAIFREGLIEGGFWHAIGQLFREKAEREMSAIYYIER